MDKQNTIKEADAASILLYFGKETIETYLLVKETVITDDQSNPYVSPTDVRRLFNRSTCVSWICIHKIALKYTVTYCHT